MTTHETTYRVTGKRMEKDGSIVTAPLIPYTTRHRPRIGLVYTIIGPNHDPKLSSCTECRRAPGKLETVIPGEKGQ